ncbi:MAG: hypothetical protein JXB29_03655 [Sedimentisphaerales bacterium]|nr:hypothetical protein [Sedimentisphaerales bacterium]
MITEQKKRALLRVVLTFCCLAGVAEAKAKEPIDVGNRRQLFIDEKFIAESENITLTMNPPEYAGVALAGDKPWDEGFMTGSTIVEDGGVYKFYYNGFEGHTYGRKGVDNFSCLAVSKDGIVWEKPNLGQVEYKGSKANNLLALPDIHQVTIDPKASADARYKAVTLTRYSMTDSRSGVYLYQSPDGINWSRPVYLLPLWPDGATQFFYDHDLKKYVAYMRSWNYPTWENRPEAKVHDESKWPHGFLRTVSRVEFDDCTKPWPFTPLKEPFHLWGKNKIATPSKEFPVVLEADLNDPPYSDIYGGYIHKYPRAANAYFAFSSIYQHFPDETKNAGLLDIQLSVSRDGIKFNRLRSPYVGLGLPGSAREGQLYTVVGFIPSGDQIFQYFTAMPANHGHMHKEAHGVKHTSHIYRYVQRVDGFVSADAAYTGGTLTTPTIVFSDKNLIVNIDTSAVGKAQIEILDENGKPIEGFDLANCDTIMGNFPNKIVTWQGKSDLSALIGKPVRLRFVMRAAKLYAFQFKTMENLWRWPL